MFILMISFFDVSNVVCFSFFKRCANLLILQLEVKIVVYITHVALSTSFVVVKMDPDRYHNEGANHAWGNSNVSYFPPPPPPVETPQPTVHVEIPQPTAKVKAPIFHPTTQVNAGLFHVPTSFKPAPLGSKIKILINELVHLDNFVCYNTLCLMNVLDQSLYCKCR